jgi:hypothetical protein
MRCIFCDVFVNLGEFGDVAVRMTPKTLPEPKEAHESSNGVGKEEKKEGKKQKRMTVL